MNKKTLQADSLHKTNPAHIITACIGIILAVAGIHHGIFEILQGNKPANSLVIQAIGLEYQRWQNGDEAFTIIPNFLFTGIAAIAVSGFIIFWSVTSLLKNRALLIFFVSFILLTLVGGGIGHILFFLITVAYATRINKPLPFWRKILHPRIRNILSKLWIFPLIITVLSFLAGLEISVFGIPGINDDAAILSICWSFLLAALIFINISYISGFAYTIKTGQG